MTAIETAPKVDRHAPSSARRTHRSSAGAARSSTTSRFPGTVYMAVVRSPVPARADQERRTSTPHARRKVSSRPSRGADLADEWAGGLPCAWPVTEDIKMPPHYPLASDEARYQGDGVAVVVAESRALAKDAAELVEVDYEPLPSIADVEKALEDGAPLVHDDLGTNECYVWKLETDDVQAAIDAADVVVTRRYFQPRLIPNAMEPRGVLAQVGPTGDVTLWSATQIAAHPPLRAAARARDPRVEDPGHRPGRRRRLRLEAPVYAEESARRRRSRGGSGAR